MNAPELVFSANANRPTPGVKVPVAAPSWALERTVAASCWSVRPPAGGNCCGRGGAAGASSETAGGGPVVAGPVVVVDVLVALSEADSEADPLWLDEPQPASPSRMATITGVGIRLAAFIMSLRQGSKAALILRC